MSAAANPARPDLVGVVPMYYPIVEHRRFGSVKAMCKRMGFPSNVIADYVQRALVERSDYLVVDCLTLGDPEHKLCAVLVMQPGGAVILCAGLFGAATEDKKQAHALAAEFSESTEFAGKLVAVGEFRANPKGVLQ